MRTLAKFETIDEANAYVRYRVRKDMISIGVNDWRVVNEALKLNKHKYIVVQDLKFNEVGGIEYEGMYRVYIRHKSEG